MSENSTNTGKLRIAVLGAGQHSIEHHGPPLRRIQSQQPDALELVAVCDLDQARAKDYAERFGFGKVYADLDEMLAAEKLDGLVVVTPVKLTASLATRLLPRQIPLMIEKPPGQSPDETRQLLKLAEQYNTPHMVSLNRRFNPALLRAKQWLAENAADRPPQLAVARMLRYNRREPPFAVDTGIHLIDATNCLMGQPTHVSGWQNDRVWSSRVDYANGAAANIIIAPQAGLIEETYELIGPDYSLRIDTMKCRLEVFEAGKAVLDWQAPDDEEPVYRCGAVGETEHFINVIRRGQSMSATIRDALFSMLVAEATSTGGEVDIRE
ncbi:MAG: Gfo/Idh/MocA family oxidoreductase [Phycisphaerae bacterium]|nr:Gfo/Idh/MocA family oxidoreductase [Phycisphaerae bacterium]